MSLNGNAEGKVLRGKINKLSVLQGYSAYEVAVLNGFSGTEEEWLLTLRGYGIYLTVADPTAADEGKYFRLEQVDSGTHAIQPKDLILGQAGDLYVVESCTEERVYVGFLMNLVGPQGEKGEPGDGTGSGLPEVTEADNGKIPMVVAGKWENVDFPAGTQYEVKNMIVPASSWVNNGSVIHAVVYGFEKNLNNCRVDAYVSSSASKEQIEEMARCGVMGRTATGTEVTLEALYAIPTIDLPFDFVITKPTTLAYSVDEESMTLTIVEE